MKILVTLFILLFTMSYCYAKPMDSGSSMAWVGISRPNVFIGIDLKTIHAELSGGQIQFLEMIIVSEEGRIISLKDLDCSNKKVTTHKITFYNKRWQVASSIVNPYADLNQLEIKELCYPSFPY
jgi:hypothetical protein